MIFQYIWKPIDDHRRFGKTNSEPNQHLPWRIFPHSMHSVAHEIRVFFCNCNAHLLTEKKTQR